MRKWALVVDDDVAVRTILPPLLKAYHYDTEAAGGPGEALERIARRAFDVIFTDYEMPGMSGIELVRIIRERSFRSAVILMTGLVADEVPGSSLADALLQKPFTMDTIRRALDEAMARRRG